MLLFAVTTAHAADIHLDFASEDGIAEQAQWRSTETFSDRFGPVETKKKGSAVYAVTVMPSVFDPLENAYRVELNTCIEWSRKGSLDRICQKDELLARPEGTTPAENSWEIKGGAKFAWTAKVWFTGESPPAGAGPAKVEEPTE